MQADDARAFLRVPWGLLASALLALAAAAAAEEPADSHGFWSAAQLERLDRGLQVINCDRRDLRFQKQPIDDPFRLAAVARALDDPLSVGGEAAAWEAAVRDERGLVALLAEAARVLPPLPGSDENLESVAVTSAAEIAALLPDKSRALLARLLEHGPALRAQAERAFAPLGAERDAFLKKALGSLVEKPALRVEAAELTDVRFLELLQLVDRGALASLQLAIELGHELGQMLAAERPAEGFSWRSEPDAPLRAQSALGPVLLYGADDDVHPADERAAIVIDLGGDNTWLSGASASVLPGYDMPVAIAIDVAGNDTYRGGDLSFGAALGGAALQWDGGGHDAWIAGNVSLGAGIAGAGVLYEGGGDDLMRMKDFGEGAGAYGIGVLYDVSGNDMIHVDLFGQGFGYTLGCGICIDFAGHDTYDAGGAHSDAPLHRDRTQSLSQGFGFGARPDASGGVGVLIDVAGNDRYSADVFGQGASYWYALGLLLDQDGNDTYVLGHYGQGAGIHLSAGMLHDRAGQDLYYTEYGVGIGGAHDFAVGFLVDREGDNHYCGSGGSQGGALTNSVAILFDDSGDDGYTAVRTGSSHGSSAPARDTGGIGLLLDGSGKDMYSQSDRDGRVWTEGVVGAGLDEPAQPDQPPPADPMGAEISSAAAAARVDDEGRVASADGQPVDDLDKLWAIGIRWQVGDERVIGPIARARLVALGAPALDRAIERLGSKDGLELECAEALFKAFPPDEVAARLLTATSSTDAPTRRSAVRFLGSLGVASARDRLVELLDDTEVRLQALRALGALKQASPAVAGMLRATKELEGVAAALCLGAAGDEQSIQALTGALAGETPFLVRIAVEQSLAKLGDSAVPELTRTAAAGSSVRARRSALRALGASRSAAAIAIVKSALGDTDPWIRLSARHASASLQKDLPQEATADLAAAVQLSGKSETDPLLLRLRDQ